MIQPSKDTNDKHVFYIPNSGLVLLSPYINHLFERLGLICEGKFVSSEAAGKACHCLEYLVTKITDAPEPELVLNKLLCGLAPDAQIPYAIELSDEERELMNGLLKAVINNWQVIRNTSIEGLQQTFLRREGKLMNTSERWDLQVQRKGLDVLLDQIPWAFSVVKFPWMLQALYVSW